MAGRLSFGPGERLTGKSPLRSESVLGGVTYVLRSESRTSDQVWQRLWQLSMVTADRVTFLAGFGCEGCADSHCQARVDGRLDCKVRSGPGAIRFSSDIASSALLSGASTRRPSESHDSRTPSDGGIVDLDSHTPPPSPPKPGRTTSTSRRIGIAGQVKSSTGRTGRTYRAYLMSNNERTRNHYMHKPHPTSSEKPSRCSLTSPLLCNSRSKSTLCPPQSSSAPMGEL